MIVYRLCKEEEIREIISTKSFKKIGKKCQNNPNVNTHKYIEGHNYLHFFKDYSCIYYLNISKGNYICTYDIPDEILRKNIGIGYYLDRFFMRNLDSVEEYAIESTLINYSFLKQVAKINGYIDFEDYLEGSHDKYIETIYDKSEKIYKK